jgi:ABC-2 type transport system permease protein
MNYYRQVLTVTLWEYRRFFKIKIEIIGIAIMLLVFGVSYLGGKYATSRSSEKPHLMVLKNLNPQLIEILSNDFVVEPISIEEKEKRLLQIASQKEGMLLLQEGESFVIHSWKKPKRLNALQENLKIYCQHEAMAKINLSTSDLEYVMRPADLKEVYLYEAGTNDRSVLAFFFAGLMIMAVFLSFAYQFTAITGEKQLKITEQIISAIKPQAWMDGKILGITLTGLSSMLTYSIIGTLGGMLFFQFTGGSVSSILQYLHLPSILLFFMFTLMGVMMWNAFLAAIASMITDPNNSGKSGVMLLPLIFVFSSFLVMRDPDNGVSVFLSWFPLTSATAMPMRWVATELAWWEFAGSFVVLAATFYLLRKLAAKIFHVSVLISGKEPTWREVFKLARES